MDYLVLIAVTGSESTGTEISDAFMPSCRFRRRHDWFMEADNIDRYDLTDFAENTVKLEPKSHSRVHTWL